MCGQATTQTASGTPFPTFKVGDKVKSTFNKDCTYTVTKAPKDGKVNVKVPNGFEYIGEPVDIFYPAPYAPEEGIDPSLPYAERQAD